MSKELPVVTDSDSVVPSHPANHHLRFHRPHAHLAPVFGNDWFALKAESFARFFGTPFFLITQYAMVSIHRIMQATSS
jgi:hypothetical protein